MSEPGQPSNPSPSPSPLSGEREPERRRSRVKLAIYIILTAVIFFYVGRAFVRSFNKMDWDRVRLDPLFVVLTILCLSVHRLSNGMVWNVVLKSFGTRLSYARTIGISALSILGGYLPGKMAGATGGVIMLAKSGVRLPVAMAALFLVMAMTILSGLIMAVPLTIEPILRALSDLKSVPDLRGHPAWMWTGAIALALAGLIYLHPKVFVRLCNLVLHRLRREPIPHNMATRPYAVALGMSFARYLFLGMSVWLAGRAVVPLGFEHYPLVLGTTIFMSVGGMLAGFTPAALGVQEGICLWLLGPVLGPDAALVAVSFRLIRTIVDLGTAGIGLMLIKHSSRQPPAGAELASTSPRD